MTSRGRRSTQRVVAGRHPSLPGRVNFVCDEIEGSGRILNISAGGAAIEDATECLEVGGKAELFFLQPGTGRKLRAVAEVVRTNPGGFAVRFLRLERELKQLVMRAAKGDEHRS